jgi:hypothetical protein
MGSILQEYTEGADGIILVVKDTWGVALSDTLRVTHYKRDFH